MAYDKHIDITGKAHAADQARREIDEAMAEGDHARAAELGVPFPRLKMPLVRAF
ncbi:hypothetical protein [Tranquillimonas alkanivorans]|uniref:Uncharacterized protein n=1 Tax=Tranquillimonas alkanivorans TaxID=441119 RepID=A0A1I5TUZ3_9RHOB|nr:hypothetical protein [Tranquillimonas alkanivorans]SFP86864.1 hypothetical protein SAMN04488047_11542 [Tranquillimonas alkanivorans]